MININMVKKFFVIMAATVLATQLHAAPKASAAKSEPVKVVLEQFKVTVDAQGKEVLAVSKDVKPGEVLEYKATYTNVSAKSIGDLVATLPVPKGTHYQAKTANPSVGAEATIDTITFAPVPLMSADKKQQIPAKEYRALRWKVSSLKAGDAVVVAIRVKVNQE